MWLFTVHGFFSIVKKGDLFHVRSREKHDLENLRELVAGLPAVQDSFKHSDYPFRLLLDKGQKNAVITALGDSIDYPNFKSAVGVKPGQQDKLGKYHEIWAAMAD